jgi:hypothetical protein
MIFIALMYSDTKCGLSFMKLCNVDGKNKRNIRMRSRAPSRSSRSQLLCCGFCSRKTLLSCPHQNYQYTTRIDLLQKQWSLIFKLILTNILKWIIIHSAATSIAYISRSLFLNKILMIFVFNNVNTNILAFDR